MKRMGKIAALFTAMTMVFSGFSVAAADVVGATSSNIVFNVDAEVEVYEIAQEAEMGSFKVIFLDWNGTILSEQEIKAGEAAVAPEKPLRDGYAFIGWNKDFSAVAGDLTVTARYEPIFTVRYNNGVVAKVNNGTDAVIEGYVVAAVYDESGRLADLERIEFDTAVGEVDQIRFDMDISDYLTADLDCKVFFWGKDFVPLTTIWRIS